MCTTSSAQRTQVFHHALTYAKRSLKSITNNAWILSTRLLDHIGQNLQHDFQGYVHWGKLLAVEGSHCRMKGPTDRLNLLRISFPLLFISFQVRNFAAQALLYLDCHHKAIDRETSLCSAAEEKTKMQSDQGRLVLNISSAKPQTTYVSVLQCVRAIVSNSS